MKHLGTTSTASEY